MLNSNKNEQAEGIVVESLPSAMFRVKVNEKIVLGHLSGKMRIHYIKVMPGDRVLIKLSPDGNRGIISRRL
ncbi:MAG: translation initiation factor IF-1 [Candidatus Paceibacterota bacterium]|jgi:translation initiation factor IF-1